MKMVGKLGGIVLVALTVTACDGGEDVPTSGRQVIAGRDIDNLFFWKRRTLGFTRDTADPTQPEPEDFFVWQLDEEAPFMALPGVRWSAPDSLPLWVAGDLLMTGGQLERVYDIGNRQAANLLLDFPGIPPGDPPGGVTTFRNLLAKTDMRSDGQALAKVLGGTPSTLVVGRPGDLRAHPMPEGASVGAAVFIGTDLALLVRQQTDAGDVVGLQRMDTATGALTPMGAATPADEWVGITGFCDGIDPACGIFGTVGCTIHASACPDGKPAPCLVLYAKVDPDDAPRTAAYVYDVGAATGRKLAGADPDAFFGDGANHLLAWSSSTNEITRYWNMCSDQQGECPFAGQLAAFRPDGGGLVMYGPADFMKVVDIAGGTCTQPDQAAGFGVNQVQYSPAGDRMWWIGASDAQASSYTLWLADGAAQAPVALTSGSLLGASFSPDAQHMYTFHVGESTAALGLIDVNTSPPAERILSTNYGDVGLLGDRRAVFVDHFNAQDGNGELVLVELATGATRTLARAVTDVTVAGRLEEEGTDVAYSVRGRAGSSRDGLWLTTLPP